MSNASNPRVRPTKTVPQDPPTVIGVDLGVKRLVVAASASARPHVASSYSVGGGVARDLFDGLGDTLGRLQALPGDTAAAEAETVAIYERLIRQRIGVAARSITGYCLQVGAHVVAVETLTYGGCDFEAAARGSTKAGAWILPTMRACLERTLAEDGIRTERVAHGHTTQRCHVCGELSDSYLAPLRIERINFPSVDSSF